MPRVTEVKSLEGCLESVRVQELSVDPPVDEGLMRRLAVLGDLQYFPDFPRPYFRVSRPRGWVVQGVLGNRSIRVTFSTLADEDAEEVLRRAVEGTGDG